MSRFNIEQIEAQMLRPLYLLNEDHTYRQATSLEEWASSLSDPARVVARDTVGDFGISTIFLGINHAIMSATPLLFETAIFDPKGVSIGGRYETWAQAVQGHALTVKAVRLAYDL